MKDNIQGLIDIREGYLKVYHDSWDEDKGDYTLPMPKEVDTLADEIKDELVANKTSLDVDFILESLSMLGDAPQLVYDDNGHWAVTGSGFSPVVMSDSGKFEDTETLSAVVEPEQWHDTIREAVIHYVGDEK